MRTRTLDRFSGVFLHSALKSLLDPGLAERAVEDDVPDGDVGPDRSEPGLLAETFQVRSSGSLPVPPTFRPAEGDVSGRGTCPVDGFRSSVRGGLVGRRASGPFGHFLLVTNRSRIPRRGTWRFHPRRRGIRPGWDDGRRTSRGSGRSGRRDGCRGLPPTRAAPGIDERLHELVVGSPGSWAQREPAVVEHVRAVLEPGPRSGDRCRTAAAPPSPRP